MASIVSSYFLFCFIVHAVQGSCNTPLGLQSGKIKNYQITASSEKNFHYGARNARLNRIGNAGGAGAWIAKTNDLNEWLQVDFGDQVTISGVATQGRPTYPQWVTMYKISYSADGKAFKDYKQKGQVVKFVGNQDSNTMKMNHLEPTVARYIRITVLAFHGAISLRAEFYGCDKVLAVSGGYSQWGDWEQCPVTCGGGSRARTRQCDNPTPKDCAFLGPSQETKSCGEDPCTNISVSGGYSEWGDWGKCSVTCGNGSRVRSRECNNPAPQPGGANCSSLGPSQEFGPCNQSSCPSTTVDGGYSEWGDWGNCSVSCGNGSRVRSRECNNPAPRFGGINCSSLGPSQESGPCNQSSCSNETISGGYSQWGDWEQCTVTCGGGSRARTRQCDNPTPQHGGADCASLGPSQETEACNESPCSGSVGQVGPVGPAVDGGYNKWSKWGGCSTTCGPGVRPRTRACTKPAPERGGNNCSSLGPDTQTKACNTKKGQKCKISADGGYSEWGDWGRCSVTCGNGSRVRGRKCNNPAPKRGGADCSALGPKQESERCNTTSCPTPGPVDGGFSKWSKWAACSTTCGQGSRTRTRACTKPAPERGGSNCSSLGPDTETRECRPKKWQRCRTPADGGYSEWGNWGQCSVTCGNGSRVRGRKCNNPAPKRGGANCLSLGPKQESGPCNTTSCGPVDGGYSRWSKWGDCSTTCDPGVRTRTRACTKPAPERGGTDCSSLGTDTETKSCKIKKAQRCKSWKRFGPA